MERFLIIGNDKLGRKLAHLIGQPDNLAVVLDVSSDWRRVLRLVRSGRLRLKHLLKMLPAEWMRTDYRIHTPYRIRSNADLLQLMERFSVKKVYLFRAGLILNRRVLARNVSFLNVHCACLPAYGGLAAIARALEDRALEQEACLHRVTRRVDGGDVIKSRAYRLDERRSYRANEETAYDAGIQLLLDELTSAE